MYSPINSQLFMTAFAGAVASMATGGWIVDPDSADYSNVTQIAGAYAQAVDTAWDSEVQLTAVEMFTYLSTSQAQFRNFVPSPVTGPEADRLKLPANWTVSARAVMGIVEESVQYMGAQGIAPSYFIGIGCLPVPEQYLLPGETPAELTASKGWDGPINRMLQAELTVGLSPNASYQCSNDLVTRTGNTVYGQQAETVYGSGTGNHSLWTMTGVTDVKLFGIRANGNLQGAGGYTVANAFQINNSSRITVEGCYAYEFGATYGNGIQVYGNSFHVTLNGNTVYKNTITDGLATTISIATNVPARAFLKVTNNWCYSIADNSDDSAVYVGLALVGATEDFVVTGNLFQQLGQGFTCGYGSNDIAFKGLIENNWFYNCVQNGLYNTAGAGGAPNRQLNATGNMFVYCGGGAEFVGRSSMWLGGIQQNVQDNMIVHSGYRPNGTNRPYHYGAIYNPQTTYGIGGNVSNNTVIHSYYIGMGLDAPKNLTMSGNYAEAQYPYAIGTSTTGAGNLALNFNNNRGAITTGLAGDGLELSSIASVPFKSANLAGNQMIGNVGAGSIGYNVGPYVSGVMQNNESVGCNTSLTVAGETCTRLGRGFYVVDNTWQDAINAMNFTSIPAGDSWLYIQGNRYVNCTNRYTSSGAGNVRLRNAVSLAPVKIIMSDAIPNLGADNWSIGDQILLNPVVDGKCIAYCNVAGPGGAPTNFLTLTGT